eukprot:jgi/Mesvir1/23411/Mv21103-RA.1
MHHVYPRSSDTAQGAPPRPPASEADQGQLLHEMAFCLGIDPYRDADGLWLSREALNTPLPAGWSMSRQGDGLLTFVDTQSGAQTDRHPLEVHFRARASSSQAMGHASMSERPDVGRDHGCPRDPAPFYGGVPQPSAPEPPHVNGGGPEMHTKEPGNRYPSGMPAVAAHNDRVAMEGAYADPRTLEYDKGGAGSGVGGGEQGERSDTRQAPSRDMQPLQGGGGGGRGGGRGGGGGGGYDARYDQYPAFVPKLSRSARHATSPEPASFLSGSSSGDTVPWERGRAYWQAHGQFPPALTRGGEGGWEEPAYASINGSTPAGQSMHSLTGQSMHSLTGQSMHSPPPQLSPSAAAQGLQQPPPPRGGGYGHPMSTGGDPEHAAGAPPGDHSRYPGPPAGRAAGDSARPPSSSPPMSHSPPTNGHNMPPGGSHNGQRSPRVAHQSQASILTNGPAGVGFQGPPGSLSPRAGFPSSPPAPQPSSSSSPYASQGGSHLGFPGSPPFGSPKLSTTTLGPNQGAAEGPPRTGLGPRDGDGPTGEPRAGASGYYTTSPMALSDGSAFGARHLQMQAQQLPNGGTGNTGPQSLSSMDAAFNAVIAANLGGPGSSQMGGVGVSNGVMGPSAGAMGNGLVGSTMGMGYGPGGMRGPMPSLGSMPLANGFKWDQMTPWDANKGALEKQLVSGAKYAAIKEELKHERDRVAKLEEELKSARDAARLQQKGFQKKLEKLLADQQVALEASAKEKAQMMDQLVGMGLRQSEREDHYQSQMDIVDRKVRLALREKEEAAAKKLAEEREQMKQDLEAAVVFERQQVAMVVQRSVREAVEKAKQEQAMEIGWWRKREEQLMADLRTEKARTEEMVALMAKVTAEFGSGRDSAAKQVAAMEAALKQKELALLASFKEEKEALAREAAAKMAEAEAKAKEALVTSIKEARAAALAEAEKAAEADKRQALRGAQEEAEKKLRELETRLMKEVEEQRRLVAMETGRKEGLEAALEKAQGEMEELQQALAAAAAAAAAPPATEEPKVDSKASEAKSAEDVMNASMARKAQATAYRNAKLDDLLQMKATIAGLRMWVNELHREVTDARSISFNQSKAAKDALDNINRALAAATDKFRTAQKERRILNNKLLELKGNIRVFCRIRPRFPREKEEIATVAVGQMDVEVTTDEGEGKGRKIRRFAMDQVLSSDVSQSEVFEEMEPLVMSALDGYNVCIFAYGQTGSGKTYTMEGTESDRGLTYRALSLMFRTASDAGFCGDASYQFHVTMVEIYNDTIRDLLCKEPKNQKPLEVRQGTTGEPYIHNVETVPVSSTIDVMKLMRLAGCNRATGVTEMNAHSSRSHLIIAIHVTQVRDGAVAGRSKLSLVDLAGSERLARTGATGARLVEAQHINKSLSMLGTCMAALATRIKKGQAKPHIPYRDCKLTHVLADSLGGDSKTLMFTHLSPVASSASESICTLTFASRVRSIELGAATKRVTDAPSAGGSKGPSEVEHQALLDELEEKNAQVAMLQEEVRELRGKARVSTGQVAESSRQSVRGSGPLSLSPLR